jgi:anti-anti-sigma factor
MVIKTEHYQTASVIRVTGNIDTMTAPNVADYILREIAGEKIRLIADLSGVDFVSSAGLRVLLLAVKATRSRGGDFRLIGVGQDVRHVLELSGFSRILRCFDDLDQALASFPSSEA